MCAHHIAYIKNYFQVFCGGGGGLKEGKQEGKAYHFFVHSAIISKEGFKLAFAM